MILATSFTYDGVHSDLMGVVKVRVGGGLVSDSFASNVNVNQIKLKNDLEARIDSIDKEVLSIPMILYFDDNLTKDNIRRVKRWLFQDDYKKLQFDGESRVFYALADGDSTLTHNSVSSGYIELTMLTSSPFSFSNEVEIDRVADENSIDFIVNNYGDVTVPVDFEIVAPLNPTNIEIENETTGEKIIITDVLPNETIGISGQYEELYTISNIRDIYKNHNGGFISLVSGVNVLNTKGNFKYKIKTQFAYK